MPKPSVITRFAPSPTGALHIGGARTALFNYLYARHEKGKFLLRFEDTDRKRSTAEAVDNIYEGLNWLGMEWDDSPIFQFSRRERHLQVAQKLLDIGKAYRCYCSPDELKEIREKAKKIGGSVLYDGRCRERLNDHIPIDIKP
ncbi:MAG: glutamate--tRNA ligase family protein, partial [Pseudomonadota bacterium]|nr:glutamate--tRNA ligase family protein [Pseudomonadota bacterium]